MSIPINLLWGLGGQKMKDSRESTASIDTSDSLNWKVTPMLLAICAFILGGKQAFGQPITCLYPVEMKDWKDYVTAYCYLEGSYTPWENTTLEQASKMRFPARKKMMEANPIDYYQWIPYLVAFQLVFFIVPGLFWKWARKRQALDLDTILDQAQGIRDSIEEKNVREEKMNDLVGYLYETLRPSIHTTSHDRHTFTFRFLVVKMLTLVNVIYQFIFLVHFVGEGIFFGAEIIDAFSSGLTTSRFFPLEVLCDLTAARRGNMHWHTMQCYLSLNFFHDKMFGMLWAWYLILMAYSMVSFITFSFSLLPLDRSIRSYFSPSFYESNSRRIRRFYNKMLFTDGMVLLQFISKLKGHHLAVEIAERLFIKYEQSDAMSAFNYLDNHDEKNQLEVTEEQ